VHVHAGSCVSKLLRYNVLCTVCRYNVPRVAAAHHLIRHSRAAHHSSHHKSSEVTAGSASFKHASNDTCASREDPQGMDDRSDSAWQDTGRSQAVNCTLGRRSLAEIGHRLEKQQQRDANSSTSTVQMHQQAGHSGQDHGRHASAVAHAIVVRQSTRCIAACAAHCCMLTGTSAA
jgi:hypothetical protein